VALNLYLDDCSNSGLLADLLQQAGHRVVRPTDADVGLDGEDDQVHLAFAAANSLTIVTKNPGDFLELHETGQGHSGILAVYQDNDATRDMSDTEIVKAITNLEEAAQSGGDPWTFPHPQQLAILTAPRDRPRGGGRGPGAPTREPGREKGQEPIKKIFIDS